MGELKAETLKNMMRDIYGYEISDDAARSLARGTGAMLAAMDMLSSLGLEGLEAPFGYPAMTAEASRISRRKG